jgi:hypothetical protein
MAFFRLVSLCHIWPESSSMFRTKAWSNSQTICAE